MEQMRVGAAVPPNVTLRDAREQLENAATLGEQKALKQWLHQYETREDAKRQHLYRQGVNGDAERAAETVLRLREKQAELAQAAADAEHGRISSKDLRNAIKEANDAAKAARAFAEGLHTNAEHRDQLLAADLADLQEEQLSRIPAMRGTLPKLLGDFAETGARAMSAGHQRPANTNPAASVQGHADELYGAVRDALRAMEATEAREKALAGPATDMADAAERFPAMASRIRR